MMEINWFSVVITSVMISECLAHDLNKCMFIDIRGSNRNNTECSTHDICAKTFNISRLTFPPYSTAGLLESMLTKCCGPCTKMKLITEFTNISELSLSTMNSSDFILPFLGRTSATTLYGHHFIPIVDLPTMYYFTPKYRTVIENLIRGCLRLYPIVLITLLLTVISGFMFWLIETWYDRTQFPRQFLTGVFEGFWYSFVSMTTVGYGDKTVRSVPARLFAVVWIITGIVLYGILLSSFTAEIFKATGQQNFPISGAKVGVLKFRGYDASLVVEHGGVVVESTASNFYSDVLTLANMLRTKKVDGLVFDRYTLAFVMSYFTWKKDNVDYYISENNTFGETYMERKDDIEFFIKNTYRTLKVYGGKQLSYGVLVKNTDVYDYFRHAIRDNRHSLEISVGSSMNEQFPKMKNADIFSSSGIYYQETVKVIGIVLGVIFFGGFIFDIHNYVKARKRRKENDEDAV